MRKRKQGRYLVRTRYSVEIESIYDAALEQLREEISGLLARLATARSKYAARELAVIDQDEDPRFGPGVKAMMLRVEVYRVPVR